MKPRQTLRVVAIPEPRWGGGLVAVTAGILLALGISGVALALVREPRSTFDIIFWLVLTCAVPLGAFAGLHFRFGRGIDAPQGLAADARRYMFDRGAVFRSESSDSRPEDVRMLSRGEIVATDRAIELRAVGEPGVPIQFACGDIKSAEVVRAFPGFGFGPLIQLSTVGGVIVQIVPVRGNAWDAFGVSYRYAHEIADELVAGRKPRDRAREE